MNAYWKKNTKKIMHKNLYLKTFQAIYNRFKINYPIYINKVPKST